MKRYRHELSLLEALVWQRLRLRPHGLIFRKQHPLDRLRLDFYCAQRALAIEVGGRAHDHFERAERDERRDAWLAAQGIETLRVTASEILRDPDAAADAIALHALSRPAAFIAERRSRRVAQQDPSDPLRGRTGGEDPSDPLRGPPPQPVGEDHPPHLDGEVAGRSPDGEARNRALSDPPHLDGEVAGRSPDGGATYNQDRI